MVIESTYIRAEDYLKTSVLGFPQPADFNKDDFNKEYTTVLKEQDVSDLSQSLSEAFNNKMNFFPFLPIYKACLKNYGVSYSENEQLGDFPINAGKITFEQEGVASSLSANRGEKSCQIVSRSAFINTPGCVIYTAIGIIDIGPEDKTRLARGERPRFYIRSYKFDPRDSVITLGLVPWIFFPLYLFILLPAWSYLFFQLEKIWQYLNKKEKVELA